jgi:chemotaxis protein methyltransferase CheR
MPSDRDCAALLEWAGPRLGLDPAGFRRVRRQVGKRLARRAAELGLAGLDRYRARLEADAAEWRVLEAACRVTISRFYRDTPVFDALRARVVPALASGARAAGRPLRCWSAGCCSGEEPYTLALLLRLEVAPRLPGLGFEVLATDADPALLERARRARYRASALAQLPPAWLAAAFERQGAEWRLRPDHAAGVRFVEQDLRVALPPGPFDLVLCRNLVYTYFDDAWRRRLTRALRDRLVPGGLLVLGKGERLPDDDPELVRLDPLPVYRLTPSCR